MKQDYNGISFTQEKIPEKIHKESILIKAAFENGSIKRMSDLEKEKPTLIAKLIGMNQGRYGSKLLKI